MEETKKGIRDGFRDRVKGKTGSRQGRVSEERGERDGKGKEGKEDDE